MRREWSRSLLCTTVCRAAATALAALALGASLRAQAREEETGAKFEALPILSYDTDAGFGYGAKGFLLNALGRRESVDGLLFLSSKGERWYRLVFSIPDFELRQGTLYPLALDLTVDFDRWVSYSFFGIGSESRYDERETYTRVPLDISCVLSRALTPDLLLQSGVRLRWLANSDVGLRLRSLPPPANSSVARSVGVLVGARLDGRDSYVNPSRGSLCQIDLELAPRLFWSNVQYLRLAIALQRYVELSWLGSVLALRGKWEMIAGHDLPVQLLVPVGGGTTVRGSVQDRYLDRLGAVVNAEWRLPLFWRFGFLLGGDGGRVWHDPRDMSFSGWVSNPVVGFRFFMDTFVVRADVGFGKESTGFFLNFGQMF